MNIFKILIPCFLSFFLLQGFSSSKIYHHYRIIDGDTIEREGIKYRLHGIDAPEKKQTCKDKSNKEWQCGEQSKELLIRLHGSVGFYCDERNKDRYKRIIAQCFYKDQQSGNMKDVNAELVRNGLALAYRRYSKDYIEAEEYAHQNKLGIWQGVFDKPWEWRRKKK